jgi:phosphotransferase system enzyme I (PtsP)
MAGDPTTAILLMAMGFDVLSMSSSNILKVRKTLSNVPLVDAQKLLQQVLNMDNQLVVKSWLEHYMHSHNLGDMVKGSAVTHKVQTPPA